MTDLVRRNDLDMMTLGKMLATSGFFDDAKSEAQAIVKVLAGQEIGFGPIAAMTGIHVIKGKVSIGANLIAARIKGSGKYTYRIREHTDAVCRIEFFEGGESIGVSEFSADDARRMGTQNMQRFPKNMLFARAISNGAKWYCPDIFGGPIYTPDELGATLDDDGNVVDTTDTGATLTPLPEPRQPRDPKDLSACKSCGAVIAWARTPNGKNAPYDVDSDGVRTNTIHFETCPSADRHRTRGVSTVIVDEQPTGRRATMITRIRGYLRTVGTSDELALDLDSLSDDELITLGTDLKARAAQPQPEAEPITAELAAI